MFRLPLRYHMLPLAYCLPTKLANKSDAYRGVCPPPSLQLITLQLFLYASMICQLAVTQNLSMEGTRMMFAEGFGMTIR